jgi:hypothetical protein
VGVGQDFGGVTPFPRRSKQRPALIVDTVQQDGQKQAVIGVAGVELLDVLRGVEEIIVGWPRSDRASL